MSNLSDTNAVDFDPFMQDVSFRGPDGQSILVNVKDIDSYYLYSVRSAITFGAQMGACIIMAVVLVAFTSRSSMRKPLFALNLASLVLGFLRSLFLALYTVSPWIEFYANFSGDMSQVTAIHYSNSIAGTIFPLLMVISVNTSLVLQAHAVCVQLNHKALRIPLFLTSVVIVLLAIGFRVAICITNIHSILHADFYGPYYLRSAALITSTIGIWWFTGIFLAKLCYTIWMRKQMGWKSMTAFHTLVIAGGCTMIVPSIFAILQHVAWKGFPENGTWTLTTTALLLPLSTLWAKMAMEEEAALLRASKLARDSSAGVEFTSTKGRFGSQTSTIAPSEKGRKNSMVPLNLNMATIDTIIEHSAPAAATRDSTEVDLESMGVRVDRSYHVKGGKV